MQILSKETNKNHTVQVEKIRQIIVTLKCYNLARNVTQAIHNEP